MTRRAYQTPADRRGEAEIARIVSAAWQLRVIPWAPVCPVDWVLVRGDDVLAVAELKTRHVERDRYQTLLLSAAKVAALDEYRRAFGVPGLLFVAFDDGVWWGDLADLTIREIRDGGRTDRNDPADREPCAFLGLDRFRRLSWHYDNAPVETRGAVTREAS